jgi:hypothetical protein
MITRTGARRSGRFGLTKSTLKPVATQHQWERAAPDSELGLAVRLSG